MIRYADRDLPVLAGVDERHLVWDPELLPTDKSISHRALLFAALARHDVRIVGLNRGKAVVLLVDALRSLGLDVEDDSEGHCVVRGCLATCVGAPVAQVYLGPSSAAARLLIGALAGLGIEAIVDGDDTLRHRPFDWIVDPLRDMGARLEYLERSGSLPIRVHSADFRGGQVATRVGSAQAVSALLFAGIAGRREVTVDYPVFARNHTQLMAAGSGDAVEEAGLRVSFKPGNFAVPPEFIVPIDPSAAAYPAALFWLLNRDRPGASMRIDGVCLNPSRLGFFDWMGDCGFRLDVLVQERRCGEPVGSLILRGGGEQRGSDLDDKARLHAMIDEIPLAVSVACLLPGRARFIALHELTFKETNRVATTRDMLAALGMVVRVSGVDIEVDGGQTLRASTAVPSFGDHRLSMCAHVLLAVHRQAGRILEGDCFQTSFPRFDEGLARFFGRVVA